MIKKIFALVLAAALVFALASCGGKSTAATVISASLPAKAGTLDPQIADTDAARTLILNTYEGLVRLSQDGGIVPGAASSYTVSPDGLTYSFTLRSDGKWHFGDTNEKELTGLTASAFDSRVTAADFVFALRRVVDPATGSPFASEFSSVLNAPNIMSGSMGADSLGVYADSDYSLRIVLSAPQSGFLRTLTQPAAMPCSESFFNACDGRYGLRLGTTTGNGPFFISRMNTDTSDVSYRLSKSDTYAGEHAAHCDYVWLYVNSDSASVLSDLKAGTYDMAFIDERSKAGLDSGKFTLSEIQNGVNCLIFNMSDAEAGSEALRAALITAMDRTAFCSNTGETEEDSLIPRICTVRPAPAALPYTSDNIPGLVASALKELGSEKIELTLTASDRYEDALKRQLQTWQKLLTVNVNITLDLLSDKELSTAVSSGKYQAALFSVTATGSDTAQYLASFASGGDIAPLLSFSSSDYNAYSAAASGADLSADGSTAAAAQDWLLAHCVLLPLSDSSVYIAEAAGVSGIWSTGSGSDIFFDSAVVSAQ